MVVLGGVAVSYDDDLDTEEEKKTSFFGLDLNTLRRYLFLVSKVPL